MKISEIEHIQIAISSEHNDDYNYRKAIADFITKVWENRRTTKGDIGFSFVNNITLARSKKIFKVTFPDKSEQFYQISY